MAKHKLFQWETVTGEAVEVGGRTVRTQSQALILRWPGGGYVWNRPVALLVEQGEEIERVPIVDLTRVLQWGLAGVGAIVSILAWLLSIKKGEGDE
jgi:hypothetical protein